MEKVYKVSITSKFTALIMVLIFGALLGFSIWVMLSPEIFEFLEDDRGFLIALAIPFGIGLLFALKMLTHSFSGFAVELHGKELVIKKSRNREEIFNVENISIGWITRINGSTIESVNFIEGADLIILEDGKETKVNCKVLGGKVFKTLIREIAMEKTPVKIN